jgi:hypothetical protein
MKNDQHINRKLAEMLASIDGAEQATPKPFLFTRVMARLQAVKESSWEKAGRYISRPSFAIAGLVAVIALNIMVLTSNHSKVNNLNARQTAQTATDYLSSNDITIDDNANTTP